MEIMTRGPYAQKKHKELPTIWWNMEMICIMKYAWKYYTEKVQILLWNCFLLIIFVFSIKNILQI
jgi:hypothetical protein